MKRILFVCMALNLCYCTKDRSVDDFNREKTLKLLARFQAANGNYKGLLLDRNQEIVGALEIDLQADIQAPAAGSSSNQGTPILKASLTYQLDDQINIQAANTYFDPDSGVYQADMEVTRANNSKEPISIAAIVSGGRIAGRLYSPGAESLATTFDLPISNENLKDIADKAKQNSKATPDSEVYSFLGHTKFHNPNDPPKKFTDKPVRIVILLPRINTDEDFLNLFSPRRTVQVSLNYDATARLLHANAVWDFGTGLLTGQVNISRAGSQPTTLSMKCLSTKSPQGQNLSCQHLTTQLGQVATTLAQLESTPSPDPVDNSGTDKSITKTFTAQQGLDGSRQKIQLNVTYPARSRFDDVVELFIPESQKILQISVHFSDILDVYFGQAQWDQNNGQVDAIGGNVGGDANNPVIPRLHCENFHFDHFDKSTGAFYCEYSSNRSATIPMDFRP